MIFSLCFLTFLVYPFHFFLFHSILGTYVPGKRPTVRHLSITQRSLVSFGRCWKTHTTRSKPFRSNARTTVTGVNKTLSVFFRKRLCLHVNCTGVPVHTFAGHGYFGKHTTERTACVRWRFFFRFLNFVHLVKIAEIYVRRARLRVYRRVIKYTQLLCMKTNENTYYQRNLDVTCTVYDRGSKRNEKKNVFNRKMLEYALECVVKKNPL